MGESEPFFSESILLAACKLSGSVYISGRDDLSYVRTDIGNTAIFAFRGSLDPHLFTYTATKYGECQIKNIGCFECLKDGNNHPASVHQGALTQFLYISNNSSVQEEACLDYERGKTVVFTGHSMGAAIALLVTLWMLDKQPRPGRPKSVFCITFGFPLIGDEILARAVRRKRWADQFCHVVLGSDIFSRILLVPSMYVCEPLEALLPYWKRSMQRVRDFMDSTEKPTEETLPLNVDGIDKFVSTVFQDCAAVVNYSSAAIVSPNNLLMAAVKHLVKLSPYRPFGHYVFCSRSGGIWIDNHFAVLPILYYALQTPDVNLEDFILGHVGYGHVLPNALQDIVKLSELSDIPLSEEGSIYQDKKMATQLEALGLGIQNCRARLSLRAAGQVMKQQRATVSKLEDEIKVKIKRAINELEKYRSHCVISGIGYYDAFKIKQRRELDFKANLHRLELAGCWDKIKQMIWVSQDSVDKFIYKNELPDDFQCREEWIRLGTHYRLIVEPLDIANYYRLGYNEDSTGHYLVNGRPRRYKILQKWLEDNEENNQLIPQTTGTDQPTKFTRDSCFWAYVEEISCLMHNNNLRDDDKSNVMVKSKCREFEERVGRLIDSNGLCMEELLTGESTFKIVVKWLWKHMTPQQKAGSPFGTFIDRHPELIQ